MEVVEGRATVEDVDAFLDALGRIGEEHGCAVQAFDARYVVDREHLARAVELANRAFERDENVARDRSVEILLYAAGRRQIDRALAMGVEAGESPVVVVVDGGGATGEDGTGGGGTNGDEADGSETNGDGSSADEAGAAAAVADLLEPDDVLGTATDEALVREFFDVSDAELAATTADLSDLVAERVVLLDVNK